VQRHQLETRPLETMDDLNPEVKRLFAAKDARRLIAIFASFDKNLEPMSGAFPLRKQGVVHKTS
jgi:hypothetical protein